ncbi:MAG TPA: phospholipase D family protein, partial [Tepidiformaceae bacterium]|nr:phospholipase D family protein [Tepidiformaceae bacterium]
MDTRLSRSVQPLTDAHPGLSGVFPLRDGLDAFAARASLADAAERTLDLQYYIWRDDLSGGLLFDAIRRAADRGVRVRLLLDDNNTSGEDRRLAALSSHPNIQIRLFNPFRMRRWRVLGYLTDFARLNRRMHNKSFTADNQATIVGGRNVADEYFGANPDLAFMDLDVLAIGAVVTDVSHDFDRYWASDSSYPAQWVISAERAGSTVHAPTVASAQDHEAAVAAYTDAVANSQYVRRVLAREPPFEWAVTHMISDDPVKALGRAAEHRLMWSRLKRFLRPEHEVELVSAYFVPGAAGTAYLVGLAKQGVSVRVLSNSLEATDVPAVHAGY